MKITLQGDYNEIQQMLSQFGMNGGHLSILQQRLDAIHEGVRILMAQSNATIQQIKEGFAGLVTGINDVDSTLDQVVTLVNTLKSQPGLATQADLDQLAALLGSAQTSVAESKDKVAGIVNQSDDTVGDPTDVSNDPNAPGPPTDDITDTSGTTDETGNTDDGEPGADTHL